MIGDAWDATSGNGPSGLNLGGLLRSLSGPLQALLPQRMSPLDEIRMRLACLELSRAVNGGVVGYRDVGDFRVLLEPERQDIVFLGRRGAGKTAAACRVAQDLATSLGQPVVAVGWREDHAKALGFRPYKGELSDLSDCVVVLDEAGLRVKPGKRDEALSEAVALARHYGISLLWASQSGAGVHREVLRQDVRMAWLELEPLQTKFDREELGDLLAQVVSIQAQTMPWPKGRLVTRHQNQWCVGTVPLPDGWSETVSRLWRK